MPSTMSSAVNGLSETEAASRQAAEGFNELPSVKRRNVFAIAFEVVREPMFLLLAACGAIYFILGDAQEAMMLLGFVFFIVGISLYQEQKTERTTAPALHPKCGGELQVGYCAGIGQDIAKLLFSPVQFRSRRVHVHRLVPGDRATRDLVIRVQANGAHKGEERHPIAHQYA